jgi:hypothetical protein
MHYPVTDLSELVEQFIKQKRGSLPEGGNLTGSVEKGIRAAVDTEGMETVLRNLYENALLYSEASPEITINLSRKGKTCLLSFRDNGRGIDRKDLDKVFRMFYRVRQQGENIRGTGLGLHIVKSVVKEHGGRITVQSEGLGKGCEFRITLPLVMQ